MSGAAAMTREAPRAGAPGLMLGAYLAKVVSVHDTDNLGRVQVRLLGFDGVGDQDGPIWARVAVPFAGASRGAFLIPSKDDEVVVQFVAGDPRWPLVVGSLWNGNNRPTEQLGGDGQTVDRWTFTGKDGSRIAIVEEEEGQATVSLTTPGNVSATLQQTGGGKIELKAAGTTVTIDTNGVTVQATSKVSVQAGQVQITAGKVDVDAALANFSGIVKCSILQSSAVISSSYTPGAGNIW
jgi:uncharacterized protein involved in type VI secretion and phage assembly